MVEEDKNEEERGAGDRAEEGFLCVLDEAVTEKTISSRSSSNEDMCARPYMRNARVLRARAVMSRS